MNIDYIITAMSPAMFGHASTVHIRLIPTNEARGYVDERTRIMATRPQHQALAQATFPQTREVVRFVDLKPGTTAIQLHYRGPPLGMDGVMPDGAVVSCYLIEVEEYQTE